MIASITGTRNLKLMFDRSEVFARIAENVKCDLEKFTKKKLNFDSAQKFVFCFSELDISVVVFQVVVFFDKIII